MCRQPCEGTLRRHFHRLKFLCRVRMSRLLACYQMRDVACQVYELVTWFESHAMQLVIHLDVLCLKHHFTHVFFRDSAWEYNAGLQASHHAFVASETGVAITPSRCYCWQNSVEVNCQSQLYAARALHTVRYPCCCDSTSQLVLVSEWALAFVYLWEMKCKLQRMTVEKKYCTGVILKQTSLLLDI